jgi:alpha-N-arabinofuranosidase
MSLDPSQPFSDAIATRLKLTVVKAAGNQRVGIANEGFWGIPVKPNARYRASFYAKTGERSTGPIRIALVSNDGATVHASAQVARVRGS